MRTRTRCHLDEMVMCVSHLVASGSGTPLTVLAVDYSVYGILQAGILEGALSFRRSYQPKDQSQAFHL